jgi:hypothetical protein
MLLACGGGRESVREAERPDVILIVIDTLRADHLGSYSYARDTTPHIDALAADATLYRRAVSHAPWTTPSVAALLTSRYPSSLGIENVQSPLPGEAVLLSELMRDAGYRTAAFVSHSFVSRKWGFDQGFDTFDESHVQGHLATTSPGLSDAAIAWLEAKLGPTPVFVLIHPSYAFFRLSAAHVYSHVKVSATSAARRPFQALYLWMLAAQAAGTLVRLAGGNAATSP